MPKQWATPAEPDRNVWGVYDDDNYRWTRGHGGTDAEPMDHWNSLVDGPLLWPELVYRYGPLTEVTAADEAALIVALAEDGDPDA
ncbi:hypothetical protein AB0I28_12355 [Phytomonospora sp. NPDC050363]|uniref:hypothetical protein n=1 Tax=Phytomonospora sp. NPDC050363 TaxID=3155642 RepID=UPI003402D1B0